MINGKVKQWFFDRNMQELDPETQLLKLYEEFGELSEGIVKVNVWEILDAIGDMGVVMHGVLIMEGIDHSPTPTLYEGVDLNRTMHYTSLAIGRFSTLGDLKHYSDTIAGFLDNIARRFDSTYYECLEMAYNEIKDRKGKVINGVFVKEADLNETENET